VYALDDPSPVPGGTSPTEASSNGAPSQWCSTAADLLRSLDLLPL
jgi:hypothetical protein